VYLLVGLGNPGRRYAKTRHNVGFLAVDRLAERAGVRCNTKQLGALVDKVLVSGSPAVIAKPQKFMNLSGQPVVSLAGYYRCEPDHIVVVHDDVDIPFGEVRVKVGGGHGGHNGLRDIKQKLGGRGEFLRIRVGVSRPPPGWDTADYVLGAWSGEEFDALDELLDRVVQAIETVVKDGPKQAMNTLNVRHGRSQEHAAEA
jgi:PTH1 family peptidyl-tRNA hydrolase